MAKRSVIPAMKSPMVRSCWVRSPPRVPWLGEQAGVVAIGGGEAGDDALGFDPHRLELGQIVQASVEEALQRALLGGEFVREAGELAAGGADILDGFDARFRDAALGLGKHVLDHRPDEVADQRPLLLFGRDARMALARRVPQSADQRQLDQLVEV